MASTEKETESYEISKEETDNVNIEIDEGLPKKEESPENPAAAAEKPEAPPVFAPNHKCPNVPLLESCNEIKTVPVQEHMLTANISRPMNDSLFPPLENAEIDSKENSLTDAKKDGRNMSASDVSSHKQVIYITLRKDVQLSKTENPWKPNRFKNESLTKEEAKTQELFNKFRGILNKLTPWNFDMLMEKIKHLEINNQKRLQGVVDLVFEKAVDVPNFLGTYAAMCAKLSTLKVPADNAPDQCVNSRALIISKCQNRFVSFIDKEDEQVMKFQAELAACTDPVKSKELQLILDEEKRRVRMRSVAMVRFIGEIYKFKMVTWKIMVYCMNCLIDKQEDEKLECLCGLVTTIGKQLESEVKKNRINMCDTIPTIESIFKKMQNIVDCKSNKISSRVRFMLQDVIELRKRRWVIKSVDGPSAFLVPLPLTQYKLKRDKMNICK